MIPVSYTHLDVYKRQVNTEQNLLEMLLGTCKVKLDTNSMSTSDKTDVKIILKKAEAEQFRLYVMKLMQGQEGGFEEKYSKEDKDHWAIQTNMGDIFTHGLFSVNLLSVLVVIGCVVGAAGMVLQVIHSVSVGESIVKMLLSVLMLIAIFSSAIWNIVKGFIQYYDFKIDRNENKLYIRYGILKKVNYTIPAEKISALKLKQTFFARLTGRYTAAVSYTHLDVYKRQILEILWRWQIKMKFSTIRCIHIQKR